MLDVHAPHETVHTWRDFFIHIATIAVGLLLAIALEQTVEAVHHHHQRHQLLEDMRDEARENVTICNDTRNFAAAELKVGLLWEQVLRNAPESGGRITVTIPPALRQLETAALANAGPAHHNSLPTIPVWTTAKDTQTVGLLAPQTARFFDSLLYESNWIDSFDRANLQAGNVYDARIRFLTGASPVAVLPVPNTLTMTSAQRDALLESLTLYETTAEGFIGQLAYFSALSSAVAAGAQSNESVRSPS